MKKVISPEERLLEVMQKHWTQPLAGKCAFDDEQRAAIKSMAEELKLEPLEQGVPETDGQLLTKAKGLVWDKISEERKSKLETEAAEFLRLVRERDGEPLEVTDADWQAWVTSLTHEFRSTEWRRKMIEKINAHRGFCPLRRWRRSPH